MNDVKDVEALFGSRVFTRATCGNAFQRMFTKK